MLLLDPSLQVRHGSRPAFPARRKSATGAVFRKPVQPPLENQAVSSTFTERPCHEILALNMMIKDLAPHVFR